MNARGWITRARFGGTRRSVAWLGGLFIVSLAALAAWDIVRGYEAVIAENRRELDSQARVVAEQTARSMQTVDVVLRHLVEQHRSGALDHLDAEQLHAYLKEQAVGLGQVDGLVLFDRDGRVRAASIFPPAQAAQINMSPLVPFKRLRDEPRIGLMIDDAMRGPGSGRWIFPVGRRLTSASGEFVGAVAAGSRVDYFQQFYRDSYPDPATRIALLHRDGTLLARHPPLESALGKVLPRVTDLLATVEAGGAVPLRMTSPLDGIERFGVLRLVPDYPLAVVVSRDADVALAPWRALAYGGALRTLALAAFAALLLALARRQLKRLQSARASLETSQERYAAAAAGSDDGIWDWDLQAGTAYESRRARELQGLPLEPETQPIGVLKSLLTYHPDDAHRRASAMQAHLDGDTPAYEVDYRVRRDGEYRWIHVRAVCIRDASGKPVRLAGSVSDIDARKRAEEALRESEERYALAMTGSNEGHWLWDIPAKQMYVSAKLAELLGFAGGAHVMADSEYFARLPVHPDDRERVHRSRNDHLAGLTPRLDHEFRIVVPGSGEVRWIHTRAQCFRDAQGEPVRMAGATVDATDRKRAEDALRRSEEHYALAIGGLRGGHWVWEAESDTLFMSPAVAELFGLPPDAPPTTLAAWSAAVRLHPDDGRAVRRTGMDLARGRVEHADFEYRVLVDGNVRWLSTRARTFRDADGLRVAGVSVDIGERKRTEQALRESEDRFAVAVAGSDDGIWVWNYAAGTAYASQRASEIVGLQDNPELQPLDQWHAQMSGLLHPDDVPRRQAAIAGHLSGALPTYEGEYRVRMPQGHYRWVRVRGTCTRDGHGRPLRFAGSVSDIDARKRAEQELRASEERYALAMSGLRGGHWVWDTDTDALFVSGSLNELFGLPTELQPTTRSAYFERITLHPDDRAFVQRVGDDFEAGRTEQADYEFRIVVDGTARWVSTRAQAFRTPEGLRIAGVSVDIDDRKRTEEALRASEERFALVVAGTQDGVYDWDMVANRMYASERACEILGIPADRLVRSRAEWVGQIRIHPDDLPRYQQAVEQRREDGARATVLEYRVQQPDGAWRWIQARGRNVLDARGRPVRRVGSLSDIDAERRTAEALRRSEERYQLAVEGSNEGLWDWDLPSDMLFLSPRAQLLTFAEAGAPLRPRREWVERTDYHPDDLEAVRNALGAHLRGETPHFSVEYRLRHHRGEWRWYRQRGIVVRDAGGRPYRMAGSMEDISVRKNAEVERARLEQQLRQAQKLEAIGTLAGGIAHDFNNILSAILGYGEMVQKEADAGTPMRRHIDAAMSAGMRAKSLVERILAFSRGGTGERVAVPVRAVVDEALDSIAGALPSGVTLQRDLGSTDAGVLGDATQIHQVVMNLCANAVHAMKSCGVLSVVVDAATLDVPLTVATSMLPAGRYVRLCVSDTGSGIEPQLLERIFDPFFTTKDVGVGTGLGLSLVHGIVTDLGGGIAVDSQVGRGTSFTIYLPWQHYRAEAVEAEEAIAPGNGQTVLLVDDEEALVRLGEETLAELGYEPVGFTSALEALEAFRAEPDRFDAVLSDEAMPGMTGLELFAEIRRLRPAVPLVLMTGFVTAAISERARADGVADVLVKPLVSRDIARSLAAVLRNRQAASAEIEAAL